MKILLSPALFTCLCTIALSQQPIWTATAPIEGGAISKVWADSVGNIYAGAEFDGLYRSTNAGAFWQKTSNGLGGSRVTNFTVNHQGHVFVLTDFGLYRSTNNGESWSNVWIFFEAYSVLTTSDGKIFVGASQDWGVGLFSRSTDNGLTWSYLDPPRYSIFYSLLINSSGHLFGCGGYGVFKSTNDGTTWDSVNTGILGSRYVPALAIDSSGDIYASVYNNGVFKTTNSGASWFQIGLAGITLEDLSIARNGFIFAATYSGVFRSTNNGSSWTQFNNGLSNTNVECVGTSGSTGVYAGTFGSGVFRSTDLGASWQQSTNGITHKVVNTLAVHNGNVYAGVDYGGGIVRSTNIGASWASIGLQGTSIFKLAIKANGIMFAVDYSRILKSTDGGSNWLDVGIPPANSDGSGFACSPNGFDFVWRDSMLYRSSNEGATWTRLPYVFPRFVWKIVAKPSNGFLFAVVPNQQVYRSTNNGDSWQLMNDGITVRSLRTIGVAPNGTIVVAYDSVFSSTNDALTWQLCNTGLPQHAYVDAIAVNSASHIFLASNFPNTIYRSTNNCQSWENFGSGLSTGYISDLAADASDRLYLAANGVFRTTNPTTSAESSSLVIPNFFELRQNYPNPFNPETNISFDLPKSSFVTLKVFNVIGQEVSMIVNEQLEAGKYSYKIEKETVGLSSGVYLYRLTAGEFVRTRKMILLR